MRDQTEHSHVDSTCAKGQEICRAVREMTLGLTMTGHLETCLLFALSSPLEDLASINLPAAFKPVAFAGRGFWNVVVCRIRKMRPIGVPEGLGITYHHVAYRMYVTVDTDDGPLTGLYFVHSQADNRLVSWGGNAASDFRFHPARISVLADEMSVSAKGRSYSSPVEDAFSLRGECLAQPPVPQSDMFVDREEAQEYLKYQPLGLAVGRSGEVKIAEVVRDETAWNEQQFNVEEMQWNLLDNMGQKSARLEMATWVDPIDYRWRIGRASLSSR